MGNLGETHGVWGRESRGVPGPWDYLIIALKETKSFLFINRNRNTNINIYFKTKPQESLLWHSHLCNTQKLSGCYLQINLQKLLMDFSSLQESAIMLSADPSTIVTH